MARTGHRRAVPGRQRAAARAAPLRQADPRGGFSAAAGCGDRTDEESLDRARHDPYRDEPVSIERDAAPAAKARGALRRAPGSSTYASRAAAEGAHINHSGATRVTLLIGRAWRHIRRVGARLLTGLRVVGRPRMSNTRAAPAVCYAPALLPRTHSFAPDRTMPAVRLREDALMLTYAGPAYCSERCPRAYAFSRSSPSA
jgi:hypothetical protein